MPKSHNITLVSATAMTKRYREQRPDNYPICESFSKDAITALLAQPDASFLRIYYGLKEDGLMDAILVAADSKGADIIPAGHGHGHGHGHGDGEGGILEDSVRCPSDCPPPSPLNGG